MSRKQLKGEQVENFKNVAAKFSKNRVLGSHEESIIRDVFIANKQDEEIQRELLKETKTAKKALEHRDSYEHRDGNPKPTEFIGSCSIYYIKSTGK